MAESALWSPASLTALAETVTAGRPRLGRVRLVTIDGPSGSGKTTLGVELLAALARRVDTALIRTDAFATWDEPFDWWPHLETGVLQPLSQGRAGSYVANDWSSGRPVPRDQVTVEVPAVLILEGVSASRRAVADRATTAVWVEHPDRAERRERAIARDGEQIRVPLAAWQDAEDGWFAADDTRSRASIRL